jgi:4-hydroxymandelate oxidase
VVVSNHGGRQLDGAPASIEALPLVVDAVDVPVLMDSGIRSGTDVLRALALGAAAVLLGRPLLWALALESVSLALELIRTELTDALTLAGCPRPSDAAELRTNRPDRSRRTP